VNLKEKILKNSIKVEDDFWHNIQIYKELLFKWNKTHNLTGIKDEKQLDDFIVDALYPLTFIDKPKTLLDIGTGAGFPGLILAFVLKDTKVDLAEPLTKRASFLQFVKAMLKLENVSVYRKKAQELEPFVYDMITSRAVSDTKILLDISKKLRDEKTKLLFYKGERVFDEIDKSLPHKVIITQNRHYLLIDSDLKE
jgi:16S rRNA (guanine527-N7)-methyltransferase